jgi:hypothetical protein
VVVTVDVARFAAAEASKLRPDATQAPVDLVQAWSTVSQIYVEHQS